MIASSFCKGLDGEGEGGYHVEGAPPKGDLTPTAKSVEVGLYEASTDLIIIPDCL